MKVIIVLAVCIVAAFAAPPPPAANDVQTLKNEHEVSENGYKFAYETSDGVVREESGELKNVGEEGLLSVRGSFSYVYDGVTYTVNFVADENGYQPEGSHIPK